MIFATWSNHHVPANVPGEGRRDNFGRNEHALGIYDAANWPGVTRLPDGGAQLGQRSDWEASWRVGFKANPRAS